MMDIEILPTLQSQIESGQAPISIEVTGDIRVGDWPDRAYYCAEHKLQLRVNISSLGNGGVVHKCPHNGCTTQIKINPIPDWSNAPLQSEATTD